MNFNVISIDCLLHVCNTAGTMACLGNGDPSPTLSFPIVESIDIVDVRLLEHIPVLEGPIPESVQGRLHENAKFWIEELESSSFVKDIILHGYRMPFTILPWPVFKFNHRSALVQEEFVSSAIEELLVTGCIASSTECPAVCSPLSVVRNAKGKLRLVLDLRYVNQFLPKQKFKYEGLDLVVQKETSFLRSI